MRLACYYSLGLAVLLFAGCVRVMHLSQAAPQYYTLENGTYTDSAVAVLITPYRDVMDAEMNTVLGDNAMTLRHEAPEGTLGNWVADLLVERIEAHSGIRVDFTVQNRGGLRIPELAAGPVTRGKIYELMPFDNVIVIMQASGDDLQQFFDHMAARGGWPVSAGLRYVIDGYRATGVEIGGEPLDTDRIYSFAVPDFVANGGDDADFLTSRERQDLAYLVRDAIIDAVIALHQRGEMITATKDGRVTVKN